MSSMDTVIAAYSDAFKTHGHSLKSVFIPKDRQDIRFKSLCIGVDSEVPKILDYGCGLAHLYPFLQNRYPTFDYVGADIVPCFIDENKKRYPETRFELIRSPDDIPGEFDHILLSGVFNLLFEPSAAEQFEKIKSILIGLFAKTRRTLAINFMTDQVDFQQPGAYHQNPAKFCDFVRNDLTRRWSIDAATLPYEFTVVAYKQNLIDRQNGIYT